MARIAEREDRPKAATNSTAHTNSWTDRRLPRNSRVPRSAGMREREEVNKVPEATTPRGRPMSRATVIPATAKLTVCQLASSPRRRNSGESSGGNRARKKSRAAPIPPVWIIGPRQFTLDRLQRKAPASSRVSMRRFSRSLSVDRLLGAVVVQVVETLQHPIGQVCR